MANNEDLKVYNVGKTFSIEDIADLIYQDNIKGKEYKYPQVADFLNIDTYQPLQANNFDLFQNLVNLEGDIIHTVNFYAEPETKYKGIFTDLIEK